MADRTVSATLRANVSSYVASMQVAGKATRDALNEHLVGVGKSKQAYGQLATVTGAATIAIAAGIGLATAKFAQFDQAMSHVASSGADAAANLVTLRSAALEAGSSTVFTATEAANAVENLAKAGLGAADILGGALAGSLDLAAAGSFAVAEAASITAGALTQFSLSGDQAVHVADLLASGATKAQGDVRDLGLALQYVGTPLAALGVSVEETTGVLALMADHMIIGERAGTTLRSMIASLTAPSEIARKKMAELGISVFDAQGKFIGLDGVAGQLNQTLGDATDAERSLALGVIFGNEALQGANVLVDAGAEGVRNWTNEVNDGTTAAGIASVRLDNLAGDFEKLKGAIDSALIQTGAGGNDVLRTMTQTATALVDVIGGLPGPMLAGALAAAALAVAVGLAGTAYFLAAPRVLAFQAAVTVTAATATSAAVYTRLGAAVMALGSAIIPVTAALAVAAIGVGMYAKAKADARARVEAFSATLDEETGAITANTTEWARNTLMQSGVFDSAAKLGISASTLTQAYLGSASAIETVNAAMARIPDTSRSGVRGITALQAAGVAVNEALGQGRQVTEDWAIANDTAGKAARAHADQMRFLRGDVEGVGGAFGDSADASSDAADEQIENAGAVEAALEAEREEVDGLIDAYDTLRGITLGVGDAEADYQQALADTTEGIADLLAEQGKIPEGADLVGKSIKDLITEYGNLDGALDGTAEVFNENTQAGRDLRAMFRGTADDAVDLGKAIHDSVLEETNSVPAANKAMQDSLAASRASMSLTLQDLGVSKEAADALALSFIEIPDLVTTQIEADNAEELRKSEETKARLADIEVARTAKILADVSGAMSGIGEVNRAADYAARDRTINFYSHHIDDGEGGAGGVAYGGRIGGYSPHDRADNIHAMLTAGEAVISAPNVRALDSAYGRSFINSLIAGQMPQGIGAERAGYGSGGRVMSQQYAPSQPSRPSDPMRGIGNRQIIFQGYPQAKASDDITRFMTERALVAAAMPSRRDDW